jgi:hypothetical protein
VLTNHARNEDPSGESMYAGKCAQNLYYGIFTAVGWEHHSFRIQMKEKGLTNRILLTASWSFEILWPGKLSTPLRVTELVYSRLFLSCMTLSIEIFERLKSQNLHPAGCRTKGDLTGSRRKHSEKLKSSICSCPIRLKSSSN